MENINSGDLIISLYRFGAIMPSCTLDYIRDTVEAGLVTKPQEYMYSSVRDYTDEKNGFSVIAFKNSFTGKFLKIPKYILGRIRFPDRNIW